MRNMDRQTEQQMQDEYNQSMQDRQNDMDEYASSASRWNSTYENIW